MENDIWDMIQEFPTGDLLEESKCLQFVRKELNLEIGTPVPDDKFIDLMVANNVPGLNIIAMMKILEQANLLERT